MLNRIVRFIIGLYMGLGGLFMLILLAVDFLDPEWSREAKANNPLGADIIPSWFYAVAIVLTAALLFGAWQFIRDSIAKKKDADSSL